MSEKGFNYKDRARVVVVVCFIFLIALLFPLFSSPQVMNLAILGLIGAILTLGLNVFFGYCGQINFGAAGFFALGGYGVALLEEYLKIPFIISLPLAVIFSGIVVSLVSLFLVRLRGHSLALGTLAFSLAVYTSVARGFKNVTGGEDGINLKPLLLFDGSPVGEWFFYYLALATVVACCWLSWTLRKSRVGRAMTEIAQNELAALSFGVNISKYLRLGLILNSLMAGVAGGIFVKWIGWISPEYFGLMPNIIIVLALVVGGVGSIAGAVVGGIFIYILPQLMIRFAEISVLTYGVILCLSLLFLPRGIVGEIFNLYYTHRTKLNVSQSEGE